MSATMQGCGQCNRMISNSNLFFLFCFLDKNNLEAEAWNKENNYSTSRSSGKKTVEKEMAIT